MTESHKKELPSSFRRDTELSTKGLGSGRQTVLLNPVWSYVMAGGDGVRWGDMAKVVPRSS